MNALTNIFDKHGQHLATASCVLLVVIMALSLADVTTFFLDNQGADPMQSGNKNHGNRSVTAKKVLSVANLNIFGEVQRDNVPIETRDAPTTSLNLELQGVFNAELAKDSTAIIANRGKPGELYQIGERLPGNATLKEVFDDHVLIKRGARIEKLAFFDSVLMKKFGKSTASNNGRGGRSAIQAELGQEVARNANSRLQQLPDRLARRQQNLQQSRRSSSGGASIREQLSNFKSRLETEPQQVLDELGLVAVGGSDSSGYRIGSEVSASLLQQSGLRQGDVVLSVNGKAVGNATSDSALIDLAVAAGKARVEIQRGTRRFYVTVPIPE